MSDELRHFSMSRIVKVKLNKTMTVPNFDTDIKGFDWSRSVKITIEQGRSLGEEQEMGAEQE